MADLLVEQGRTDEAIATLRTHADTNDGHVRRQGADRLADVLAAQGHVDEVRAHADPGDKHAAYQLNKPLVEQNRLDELVEEVHAGTHGAAHHLLRLLLAQGTPERA